ncbi:MAG: hypothetical protein KF855_03500 [Acidobacteria bacterium]|nr:hypothetical protein [Acidobacteriota bacterium]
MNLEYHPLANLFPLMHGEDFDRLVADIKANGQLESIWTFQGKIIDGRNRYRACLQLGREPQCLEWKGNEDDLTSFIVSLNLHRRHLNESQRAMVANRLANLEKGANQHTSIDVCTTPISQSQAAEMMKVGVASVQRAREVETQGIPEMVESVDAGQVSVSAAATVAKALPPEIQKAVVAEGPKAVRETAKVIRQSEYSPEEEESIEARKKHLEDVRTSPGMKWHKLLHDIYMVLNSIRDNGGVSRLTSKWTQLDKQEYKATLTRIREGIDKIVEQLEGEIEYGSN